MKYILTIILLLIPLIVLFPQENNDEKVVYRGGMMLHTGYLAKSGLNGDNSGYCIGIGGKISFLMKNNLRFGTEGYTSRLLYANQEGYYKITWTGILVAYQLSDLRLHPVIGVTLGGGSVKDLDFLSEIDDEEGLYNIEYIHYGTFIVTPWLSLEYDIKEDMTLVLKTDAVLPLREWDKREFAFGPRVYLGILF